MNLLKIVMRSLLIFAAFAAAGSAHANLIQNGSFESPVVPVGSYTNFAAGSTGITGWTVVGVDSAVTSGSFTQSGITFQAQDGVQWLDLAGITANSNASGVLQSFATTIGAGYEITFYVGSAFDNLYFFPTTVDLSIDGGARTSYFNPAAPTTSLDWKLFTVNFVATGTTTTLTFYNGAAANNYNSALDNVSVNAIPVPEPAPLALLIAGLVAMTRVQAGRRSRHTR